MKRKKILGLLGLFVAFGFTLASCEAIVDSSLLTGETNSSTESTTEEITTEETTTEEVTSEETTTEEKEPEYYWLTIQYLDNTDGHQVAPMYRMRYVEGTKVSIVSPTIPGKQAKIPAVVVIMDKNITMRVYYIDQN